MTAGRSRRRRLAAIGGAAAVAALLPAVLPHPFVLGLATQALIWALLAVSWDFISGYTGQISFGHAGFFAIGAYAAAILSRDVGLSAWLGLGGALLITAGAGFLVGFPALRLRGHYLAIVTLGFAEIVQLVAANGGDFTGGSFGLHDFGSFPGLPAEPLARQRVVYLLVLGIVLASTALLYVLCERTRVGRIFRAIREDQVLAQGLGIDTTRYKLLAFAVSAGAAGLAGALYAYVIQLVGPPLASAVTSSMVIGMAVFGGLGTLWGPLVGALLLFGASESLRFVGLVYNLIAVGLVIMLFVIFVPRGIAGLVQGRPRRGLRADAGPRPADADVASKGG
ncbi:MAG: branched-chain amino acid ABC transporter permease [Reyranellaceae bacterium]